MIMLSCFFIALPAPGAIRMLIPCLPDSLSANQPLSALSALEKSADASSSRKSDDDYIKPRFTGLTLPVLTSDTIRKSSDLLPDLFNKDKLSTLKSRYESNFITRNLFSLIIKENQSSKEQMAVNSALYFAPFTGKTIGKIRLQQLDIFGPSFQDTLRKASGWLGRTGNAIHNKTPERKLMKLLLFNQGEKVNPQLMAENEKIIRDLPYIQDVAITLSYHGKKADTVNVLVMIKERFEYAIGGNLSSDAAGLKIIDQNMFGMGHQLMVKMMYDQPESPAFGGSIDYRISDLGGKFIRTGLGYTDTYRSRGWHAFLEKQFIASKVDWAGGISLQRFFADRFLTPYSYTRLDTAVSYFNSDIWYGKQLNNRNIYSNRGNIVVAGRYFHQTFYHQTAVPDYNSLYRDHDFIIGSIGLSRRFLFKNNRIYGYGITEDVPYGRYAELALGYDLGSGQSRPYIHLRYSKASILDGGAYFKWQLGAGGFIKSTETEQGAISLSTTYFTRQVYINRHPYRFFINMDLLSGLNRYKEEYLAINRRYGIRDFYSKDIKGDNRLKINTEAVRFLRWSYAGFRVANYFFADAAFLSNDLRKIFSDRFYAGVGIGFRVHNESLVVNVLELRLSWIPVAPNNYDPFAVNAFGQPKARFDDFLGGKPQEIIYQ